MKRVIVLLIYCTAYIFSEKDNPIHFIQNLIENASIKEGVCENQIISSYDGKTQIFDALELIKNEENGEVTVKKFSAQAVRLVINRREEGIHTIFPKK